MQTFLRNLSFIQGPPSAAVAAIVVAVAAPARTVRRIKRVLLCVKMKSKAERVYTGTEGGSVEIFCKYPNGYQYTPMYFCRDPCTTSEVLITCKKVDIVVTKKRYSAVNTASAHTFSVTIKHLKLKDSGVYYCGVDTWGFDKLTKVKLTISTAATVSTQVPLSRQSFRISTFFQYPHRDLSTAVPTVSTLAPETRQNQSISVTQFPPATTAIPGTTGLLLVFCGGMITLCCVLAALVVIYRKTSTDITSLKLAAPGNQVTHLPTDQEDIDHVYDEVLAVYSLAGPAIEDDSSVIYSTIQFPATADSVCSPYSFVAPH
ncbi:uncharacterized protein LOC124400258 [Silurus meridionalis]|uniref:uncharacterized protein LOC124400258 n=1 Tax=Silurus meridionalis TaxID=175797 RepID=UPI001EE9F5BF|nr:uncharacterized protein LOC124400258 [Silurus meridionalis]